MGPVLEGALIKRIWDMVGVVRAVDDSRHPALLEEICVLGGRFVAHVHLSGVVV